jgi:RNA polymerase sigma-70 factor (ECF subfamily)
VDGAEQALVERLRGREPGAFDALYRRHHERIWAFLARLCGKRELAEDLFQETWAQAARHAHRLEPDTRLLPWLYTIARNAHRSARRFAFFDRRKREAFGLEPASGPRAPDDEADARRRAARCERAFGALGDAQREVLLLALVEGLTHAEVAAVLGLREEAVRKRLSRARAELAEALEREESPGRSR